MDNYGQIVEWQISHPDTTLSYNLDYDAKSEGIIPPLSEEVRELPFYVQEVGYTVAHNKYYVHRKNLPSYMICYTISGSLTLEYDRNETMIDKGCCMWLDCTQPHSFSLSKGICTMEVYYVHLYGDGAKRYNQYFQTFNNSGYVDTTANATVPLYLKKVMELYKSNNRTPMTDFTASTHLSSLCLTLLECAQAGKSEKAPEYVSSIKRFLEENFSQKISLESLSQAYFVSPSYLQKQFKKYVGFSPNDYLNRIRIGNSKKLLRATTHSVNDIALTCGFSNSSYFINIFRRSEGITPLEYRKLWMPL